MAVKPLRPALWCRREKEQRHSIETLLHSCTNMNSSNFFIALYFPISGPVDRGEPGGADGGGRGGRGWPLFLHFFAPQPPALPNSYKSLHFHPFSSAPLNIPNLAGGLSVLSDRGDEILQPFNNQTLRPPLILSSLPNIHHHHHRQTFG